MSYITIDVDIDDIVSSMNKNDRITLFEILMHDGYIHKQCLIDREEGSLKLPEESIYKLKQFYDDSLNSSLQKLVDCSHKLTLEEENYIKTLAQRVNP